MQILKLLILSLEVTLSVKEKKKRFRRDRDSFLKGICHFNVQVLRESYIKPYIKRICTFPILCIQEYTLKTSISHTFIYPSGSHQSLGKKTETEISCEVLLHSQVWEKTLSTNTKTETPCRGTN